MLWELHTTCMQLVWSAFTYLWLSTVEKRGSMTDVEKWYVQFFVVVVFHAHDSCVRVLHTSRGVVLHFSANCGRKSEFLVDEIAPSWCNQGVARWRGAINWEAEFQLVVVWWREVFFLMFGEAGFNYLIGELQRIGFWGYWTVFLWFRN